MVDEAIAWHLRQDEMDEADWIDFVEWLEDDPRHAETYDRVALADGAIAAAPVRTGALREPANDRGSSRWQLTAWLTAAAACAAAVSAVLIMRPTPSSTYALETRAGETKQLALADGSRIEIAGGSRLLLDRAQPRQVTLERGEALFHVRHDASDPFVVHSGTLAVEDVGTVFNVKRDGKAFEVAVAEGSVMFQPRSEQVTLGAGAILSVDETRQQVRRGKIDAALVGGWRTGRLSFSDTPVPEVLSTIKRLYGTDLVAEDGLSSRTVTGMITLSGEARRDVPHIASLVGASWRVDGARWILSPMGSGQP
ncbi:FecR domain-containing protein [Sphingobium sp. H33]|uniref:FecR domain-containing protein n=2 Tax=Sphingobium nicotianae TaxID=2782607 RepID=A0A9X1DBG1_9SPHN|nr:FecR domain-containing protein [Sphingobium nicotianae]MBT2186962.1 FecR domain-containing protein [Sphingobium nicotianae]